MKLLLLAAVCFILAALVTARPALAQDKKILVAYFSWSGNTKSIAGQIHQKVGGELVEIVPVTPYPTDYNACTDAAKKEQQNQARPPLKTSLDNMAQYDVIFLGYPNWWSSIPMPVATFLEQYDFAGKTIVPFVSHGGGGQGRSVSDIAKLCPGANMLEALSVSSAGGGSLPNNIDAWLRKIGLSG